VLISKSCFGSRDHMLILYMTIDSFSIHLFFSLRFRQKFLLLLCYSLIVLRKRWKDVFSDAIRFCFVINHLSFFFLESQLLIYFWCLLLSSCREELMITLRLSGKGSEFLLSQVCLSLSTIAQKTRLKRYCCSFILQWKHI
jgi:hypothetical protein